MFASALIKRKAWTPLKSCLRNYPFDVPYIHYLKNIPPTQYSNLQNGLTIATEERECFNACVGFYIDAGSRYESMFENGVAHFFEHIAFKGTKLRTRTCFEDQLSVTGAKVRCYTSREMVAYYAECMCQHVPLVLNLLVDALFNNGYCSTEIETQKHVVYMEMLEHENNPSALLDDLLHSTAFQGTPLNQSVMGMSSNLCNYDHETISRYVCRMFNPSRTVLAAVGGIKHEHIVAMANSCLGEYEPTICRDIDYYRFSGSEVRFRDDSLPKANVAIAVEGPSLCHKDNVVMDVASSVLGAWDRSQGGVNNSSHRLARAGAEDRLCDSYRAFNINYKDTGLWGVQYMGESLRLEDMLFNIQDEFMKLCTIITEGELERARRELKTKLLNKTVTAAGACHEIGRLTLYMGCRPSLLERICAIDSVKAENVKEVCTKYIYDRCPVVAAVGPSEGLPEYTRIRAGMYWLRI